MTVKVLIATSSFAAQDQKPLKLLKAAGLDVIVAGLGRTLTPEEVERFTQGCCGVIAGTERLSDEILRRQDSLKVISRVGAGLDNVDLEAAKKLGIAVYNTPDGPTRAVAELTVALMLDLLRGVSRSDAGIRLGRWEKKMGFLLAGKKVGLLGLGRIGRQVAELTQAFGCQVLGVDICPDRVWAEDRNVAIVDKAELLAVADIVSLHVPCRLNDTPMIGEQELGLMKNGAFLINAARGGLVDESALAEYLEHGKLGGAALDTFSVEPYEGPLTNFDNVVLSPHVGSYAREARVQMEVAAVENLLLGLGLADQPGQGVDH